MPCQANRRNVGPPINRAPTNWLIPLIHEGAGRVYSWRLLLRQLWLSIPCAGVELLRKSYRALMARGRSEWRRVRTFSSRRALAESLSAFREWAWANRQAIRARKTQERSDYLQRVESLHSRLCRIAGLPWLEGEFTPLVTNGRAAYYYGLLERGEHRWFLKVGPPHESRYRVHRALLEGSLPREGQHFACLAPVRAAWLSPAAALYAYPYWPRLPGEIKGRHADPLVARGLAEFSLGLEPGDAPSAGLRRFSL